MVEQSWQTNDAKKLIQKKFDLDVSMLDMAFSPVVQSGGVYDVRAQAVSDNRQLKYDQIICSVGSKYFEYNSHVVRTLFINPSEQ